MNVGATGTWVDAFWHLLVEFDPAHMLRERAKQKAYLARYGRQDWYAWEHRDVTDIDEAFREVCEIVRRENERAPSAEDM